MNKPLLLISFFIGTILLVVPIDAQEKEFNLTKAQMYADFDTLYFNIKTISPQSELRKKVIGIDILKEVKQLRSEIDTVTTDAGFYDIITRALFLCQNPHTSLAFSFPDSSAVAASNKWSKYYRYGYNQKKAILYISGHYYTPPILDKEGMIRIPGGSRITAISGIPIDKYMSKWNRLMQNNTCWDSKLKKYYSLDLNDPRTLGISDHYTWTYSYQGKQATVDVADTRVQPYAGSGYFDYKVSYFPKDGVLFIRIPQMNMSKTEFLRQEILQYKGKEIRKVIMDVRGNGGGADEVWMTLLGAILDENLDLPEVLTYKNKEYLKLDMTYENYSDSKVKITQIGRDTLYSYPLGRHISVGKETIAYKGPVYILFDDRCFSSTLALLSLCKYTDRLTSVGLPNGFIGGQGITPMYCCLDESKIIFRVEKTLEGTQVRKSHLKDYFQTDIEIPLTLTYEAYGNKRDYKGYLYSEDFLYNYDPMFQKVVSLP